MFLNYKEYIFDLRYGIDTRVVPNYFRDTPENERSPEYSYQPTQIGLVNRILRDVPISYKDYILVDFGSGKGRVLLLASDFPFKKIIGVESSPTLNEIACRNIQLYKSNSKQCSNLESICINVINFKIPDEKAIFYFYNPFDEQIMNMVLLNIKNSLQNCHRDIFLVYSYPVHHHLIDNSGFLKIFKKGKGIYPKCYFIYTNNTQYCSRQET
jgi:hypothetical protein